MWDPLENFRLCRCSLFQKKVMGRLETILMDADFSVPEVSEEGVAPAEARWRGPAAQTFRGSSNPTRFEGTYELYRVELELYLNERDAWAVVSGYEVRYPTDANQQAIFDKRNRLAK
ncbi:hypothetical protein PHMEG_00013923 [Phytophthora megakarya]|uniref:Uncharacterized protein n=1 Tax=Phytophthora megakarya TaxID=4795 RepID=A0A225W524_9STRA|nr:hypothetical protein PHMEG_00013923 [Phytophthora megakarya]